MTRGLAFIVEGDCEYDSIHSLISKILNYPCYHNILNARGIGNILKNVEDLILSLIKTCQPKHIVIMFDSRDCVQDNLYSSCIECKEALYKRSIEFIKTLEEGSFKDELPEKISIVVVEKTFDTWACSDLEGLKKCELVDAVLINESYNNVDKDIDNPALWLKSKLKANIDFKSKRHRVKIFKSINPIIGTNYSRSLAKFAKEVKALDIN